MESEQMDDIVKRLRWPPIHGSEDHPVSVKLRVEAADEIERLRAERLNLDKRIHNQRVALRSNWEIIEARASYKKAWYRSPLLTALLLRNRQQPWWQRYLRKMAFLQRS